MKKLLTSAILVMGFSAYAQTTTTAPAPTASAPAAAVTAETATVSEASVKPFQKSPYSLNLETETLTGRRDGETNISNFNTNIYPMLNYQIAENNILTVYPKFVLERGENSDSSEYKTRNDYLALKFARKKIFTADQDGLDFSADVRYYSHLTETSKAANQADGKLNFRTFLDKKINDDLSVYNENRVWFYNDSTLHSSETTPNTLFDLRATPTYTLTEKVSTGVEVQYVGQNADKKDNDSLLVSPNVNYTFNEKTSLLWEVEILSFKSTDDQFFGRHTMLTGPTLTYNMSQNVTAYLIGEFPLLKDSGKFIGSDIGDQFTVELDLSILAF